MTAHWQTSDLRGRRVVGGVGVELDHKSYPGVAEKAKAMAIAGQPKAKRGAGRKLNKTEQRCLAELTAKYPDWLILSQSVVLPFGDGTSYRPDFLLIPPFWDQEFIAFIVEVKGGYRGPGWEQGMERYRRAREKWGTWLGFELWTWRKGTWEIS